MKGEGQAERALRWSEEKLSMNGSQLVAASNANEVLLLSHVIVFESRPALLSFRCLDTCVFGSVRAKSFEMFYYM